VTGTGNPTPGLNGLDGRTLKLHLVGSREYVRAVDILTAMQDLTQAIVVDIRFLRPVSRHVRISLAKQDKPDALARVYINSSNNPVYLLGDDHGPLSVLEETALPAFEVVPSGDGTGFDFSFTGSPDRATLLQTVFAQYQQISRQKFTVRRLTARAGDTGCGSTVRLTVERPKNPSRGCHGKISQNGDTLFDIWFEHRSPSD
jgi:hypothetical protein